MILPIDTVFYNYDIFVKNFEKFKEFLGNPHTAYDAILSIADLVKSENACLVWSVDTELLDVFSFNDMQKRPGCKHADFLYDFRYAEEKKNTFNISYLDYPNEYKYTFPLKDIFSQYYPYVPIYPQTVLPQFCFDGKISFKCGRFVDDNLRKKIAKNRYMYPLCENKILRLYEGVYTTASILNEIDKKKEQEKKLEQELKDLVDSMILYPL